MRTTRVIVTTVALVLLGAGAASAEPSGQEDRFMKEMKKTVYATNHHLVFSVRSSIIRWLGGVPVADPSELTAAQREKWWGQPVRVLPPLETARHER